jgi:cold shock CspA family protein
MPETIKVYSPNGCSRKRFFEAGVGRERKGQVVRQFEGYGFIGRADGPDVSVHYSAIAGEGYRTLPERDFVEFEIVRGPKGP